MKKGLKMSTVVVTITCMVFGLLSALGNITSVKAEENNTRWTFSQVGYADDGTYSYVEPVVESGQSQTELKDSMFCGYVNFSNVSSGALITQYWDGANLCIGKAVNESVWTSKFIKIGLVSANGDTYLACGRDAANQWILEDKAIHAGEEIFLQVAFNYVDKDGDTLENDLQLQVWIDGIPVSTVQKAFGDFGMVTPEDMWIKDYADASAPVMSYVMLHGGQDAAGTITGNVTIRSAYVLNVTGIENNKAYCDAVEVTLATTAPDGNVAKDLDKVTVGGTPVAVSNGKVEIPAGTGETTVVVVDKMGVSQTYNVTVNNGHTWGEYVSNQDATCQGDGTKSRQCTVCETPDSNKVADVGSKLDHVFETYVSDGDATCIADGHETAACKFGCGETDQRIAENSATDKHTYGADDKCTVCGAAKPVDSQPGGTTGSTTTGSTTTGGTTGGSSVDTGDSNSLGMIIVFMVMSTAVVAVVLGRRKMRQ